MELKESRDGAKFLTMVTDEPLSEEEASALVTMEGNMTKPTPAELAQQIEDEENGKKAPPAEPAPAEAASEGEQLPLSDRTKAEIAMGKKTAASKPPPPPEESEVNPNTTVDLDPTKVPGFKDAKGKPVEPA